MEEGAIKCISTRGRSVDERCEGEKEEEINIEIDRQDIPTAKQLWSWLKVTKLSAVLAMTALCPSITTGNKCNSVYAREKR